MLENISLSLQGIWSHKLRSFLTMLGIIIGIASIITIVSTIKGTNEQIKKNLIGAGNNVVTVSLSQDGHEYDMEYSALPRGVKSVSEETRAELDKLDFVQECSCFVSRRWADNVYYKNTAFNGKICGVDSHYLSVYDYKICAGRGFIDTDFSESHKAALVDSKSAQGLFAGENPVGKTLEIFGEPFTVVGVFSADKSSEPVINSISDYWMYSDSSSGTVLIPSSCWAIAYRYDEPMTVAVKAASTDDMAKAGDNVANSLNETQISGTKYSYTVNGILEQASELQSLSKSTNSQLIWIAGISLLVGGIGVMNIMLVSVTERTKEIGLKLAIGARQKRILWQFLTEAAVLTSLGGILGVASGIALAYMLANVMGTPVAISATACIIAVAFSMVIGIVFGLVPAVKASKLNPIDALRHE